MSRLDKDSIWQSEAEEMKQISCVPGSNMCKGVNQPILHFNGEYIWIGNDTPYDKSCYCTISKKSDMRDLALSILRRIRKGKKK